VASAGVGKRRECAFRDLSRTGQASSLYRQTPPSVGFCPFDIPTPRPTAPWTSWSRPTSSRWSHESGTHRAGKIRPFQAIQARQNPPIPGNLTQAKSASPDAQDQHGKQHDQRHPLPWVRPAYAPQGPILRVHHRHLPRGSHSHSRAIPRAPARGRSANPLWRTLCPASPLIATRSTTRS
jgi:hypothetical protein